MFKTLKLWYKNFQWIAIVLIFLCVVASIGFNSLSGVIDRVDKA